MHLKRAIISVLYSVIFFTIFVMYLNYVLAGIYYDQFPSKFGMEAKYLAFESVNEEQTLDFLLNLPSDTHITVIKERPNSSSVWIYDPANTYYTKSSKVITPSQSRYFSKDDYLSGNNVGIYFANCYDSSRPRSYDPQKDSFEPIACFDYSPILTSQKQEMINLFADPVLKGDVFYIDSPVIDEIEETAKMFEANGFKLAESGFDAKLLNQLSVLKALFTGPFWDRHTALLAQCTGCFFVLAIILNYISHRTLKQQYLIHQVFGGSLWKVWLSFYARLQAVIAGLNFVILLLLPNFLKNAGWFFSYKTAFIVWLLFEAVLLLISLITYLTVFKPQIQFWQDKKTDSSLSDGKAGIL